MLLSGQEIRRRQDKGLTIEPFSEDQLNPNSYNLALHDELLVYEEVVLDAFDKLMRSVSHPGFRKRIQQRAGLRKYALTNPMEFFAVATEVFFESPDQLRYNHPTIYKLFVEMFNQDLANHFANGIQPLTHL